MDDVDVTRRDGRAGRAEAGVRQHKGVLLDEDVTDRHGVPVVAATRLGLELPTVLDLEHSFCYVGQLLHRGDTTLDALAARYETMRHWPHSLSNEILLRRVHGECESVGEYRADFLCWKQRLPTAQRQYKIHDSSGAVVARVDFAWPRAPGCFSSSMGRSEYQRYLREGETASDAVVREKRREEMICELTGWVCIRLVWADLYQPEHTRSAHPQEALSVEGLRPDVTVCPPTPWSGDLPLDGCCTACQITVPRPAGESIPSGRNYPPPPPPLPIPLISELVDGWNGLSPLSMAYCCRKPS